MALVKGCILADMRRVSRETMSSTPLRIGICSPFGRPTQMGSNRRCCLCSRWAGMTSAMCEIRTLIAGSTQKCSPFGWVDGIVSPDLTRLPSRSLQRVGGGSGGAGSPRHGSVSRMGFEPIPSRPRVADSPERQAAILCPVPCHVVTPLSLGWVDGIVSPDLTRLPSRSLQRVGGGSGGAGSPRHGSVSRMGFEPIPSRPRVADSPERQAAILCPVPCHVPRALSCAPCPVMCPVLCHVPRALSCAPCSDNAACDPFATVPHWMPWTACPPTAMRMTS